MTEVLPVKGDTHSAAEDSDDMELEDSKIVHMNPS
jgi:hypothetical protein